MPNQLIHQKKVDIYIQPQEQETRRGEITIGDLHGNAIKLLFILIRHGIATNINKDDYQTLVDIYNTSLDDDAQLFPQSQSNDTFQQEIDDEISTSYLSSFYKHFEDPNDKDRYKEEKRSVLYSVDDLWRPENESQSPEELKKKKLTSLLETFNSIIENLTIHHHLTVRLLGDELADRGNNDYFTLKILEKLAKSGVLVEILLSNHSVEFIAAYEISGRRFLPRIMLDSGTKQLTKSLQNMQRFIDWQLISSEEIMHLINSAYKPMLKAISYSLNENKKEITIYSHAAIDLNVVKQLANKLGVPYEDKTCQVLANTIDKINEKYQKFVTAGRVHKLYSDENMSRGFKGVELSYEKAPFEFIMWNRSYKSLQRPNQHFDYHLCFVHGHDSRDPEKNKGHIVNLDNRLGIYADWNQGEYTALYTEEANVPRSESLWSRGLSFFGSFIWNVQKTHAPQAQASLQSSGSVKKVN